MSTLAQTTIHLPHYSTTGMTGAQTRTANLGRREFRTFHHPDGTSVRRTMEQHLAELGVSGRQVHTDQRTGRHTYRVVTADGAAHRVQAAFWHSLVGIPQDLYRSER